MPERLDQYLVKIGRYESRARAAAAIKAGKVRVNGEVATKASQKVSSQDNISSEVLFPYVSRGGVKLAHALEEFPVSVEGRICLDVGSSTGGFTDVLVQNGADKIYAVDVGRDQLHSSLRSNSAVISMEGIDARSLTPDMFEPLPDLIVCDASFISLFKVVSVPISLVPAGSDLIALVKPQFEVGPEFVGKGGIVTNANAREQALLSVEKWLEEDGWIVTGTTISPVTGGDGNVEFLIHAKKRAR